MVEAEGGVRVPIRESLDTGAVTCGRKDLPTVHLCWNRVDGPCQCPVPTPTARGASFSFGGYQPGNISSPIPSLEWDGPLSLELLPPLRSPGGQSGRLQGHPVLHG